AVPRLAKNLEASVDANRRRSDRDRISHDSHFHRCRLQKSAYERAPAELGLVAVVSVSSRGGECRLRRGPSAALGDRLALEGRLSLSGAPRFGGDAAQRDPRLLHISGAELDGNRRRSQGELVGFAIPDFQKE